MELGPRIWLTCILIAAGTTFGWQFHLGKRDGVARVPVKFFGGDEFHRGETMFGLAQAFNFLGLIAAVGLVFKIWIDG